MIYRVKVTKGGQTIFSHDILLQDDHSFEDQFHAAMAKFRQNFPEVALSDDDVELRLDKAP